jgi:G3E family GTPase
VAETFTFRDHQGLSLSDIARLDTCVTVVDGYNFWKDYSGLETLAQRGQGRDRDDERSIVDLLLEQIEFADVILLNKMDLISPSDELQLTGLLNRLNPRAKVYPVRFGAVDFDKVVDTRLFDFEVASQDPNWLAVERGQEQSEVDEYGFSSFVYAARRPFHPARFHAWSLEEWPGVVRSKGFFWLASRYDDACYWSQAGAQCRSEPAGVWWAAAPRRVWPTAESEIRKIEDSWLEPHGDRRQELILIGTHLDQSALKRKFDECLLTPQEMKLGVEGWKKLEDPFPNWKVTVES